MNFVKALVKLSVGIFLVFLLKIITGWISEKLLSSFLIYLTIPIFVIIGIILLSVMVSGLSCSIASLSSNNIVIKIVSIVCMLGFVAVAVINVFQFIKIVNLF